MSARLVPVAGGSVWQFRCDCEGRIFVCMADATATHTGMRYRDAWSVAQAAGWVINSKTGKYYCGLECATETCGHMVDREELRLLDDPDPKQIPRFR